MPRTRLAIAAALTLSLVAPATAKEGVRATLNAPVDIHAAPGTFVSVDWDLADAEGTPFGAGGIYLRVARCGKRRPLRIPAREVSHGRYAAGFDVPRRGIRRITVGLKGWREYPSGRRERADATFPFDPPLRRRCG